MRQGLTSAIVGGFGWFLAMLLGYCGVGSLQIEIKQQRHRLVQTVEQSFGVTISYQDVFDPFQPFQLKKVVIEGGTTLPGSMEVERLIPRVAVEIFPFNISIQEVILIGPRLSLEPFSTHEEDDVPVGSNTPWMTWLEGITEKGSMSAAQMGLVRPLIISWQEGSVVTTPSSLVMESLGALQGVLTLWDGELDLVTRGTMTGKEFNLALSWSDPGLSGTVDGEQLPLTLLAPWVPDAIDVTQGARYTGQFRFAVPRSLHTVSLSLKGRLEGLNFEHWRVADHPIRDIALELSGEWQWYPEARQLITQDFALGARGVQSKLDLVFDYQDQLALELLWELPPTLIQSVLGAIPQDLIPTVHDAQVDGTVAFSIPLDLDLTSPGEIIFEPAFTVKDYRLVQAPALANITGLTEEFTHTPRIGKSERQSFVVGPSNRNFVPLSRIGSTVTKGILTCEDGRFFSHGGFQLKHIRESLIQNIHEGRFARGASTITMQLARNLFLSGQKNLSRKFEEVLLAYALEQQLAKERLLEIYLNIIEWGPNLYGIGRASRHYFGKSPAQLDAVEAAFLGSIIANPHKYHYMYSRGEVSDQWAQYLENIVRKMGVQGLAQEDGINPYKPTFASVKPKTPYPVP